MDGELGHLYEADQADRVADPPPADVIERDRARRQRVAELLDAGAAQAAEDFFHAAMVFQHGDRPEDYQRAHELALHAAELGHRPGRWLAAAAYDRWLVHQGRPQKYGTQYTARGDAWDLYEVDPDTGDDERAEWDVPPLAEARRRAEEMTEHRPPSARGTSGATPHATCRTGDLEVHVVRLSPDAIVHTPPLSGPPLEPGDPVPWLPPGLSAGRVGNAFVATDPAGEFRLAWQRVSMPLLIGWRDEDGPPPAPEPIELGGRPAIWVGSGAGRSHVVVSQAGAQPWMVGGVCSREEVLRVAESLP